MGDEARGSVGPGCPWDLLRARNGLPAVWTWVRRRQWPVPACAVQDFGAVQKGRGTLRGVTGRVVFLRLWGEGGWFGTGSPGWSWSRL